MTGFKTIAGIGILAGFVTAVWKIADKLDSRNIDSIITFGGIAFILFAVAIALFMAVGFFHIYGRTRAPRATRSNDTKYIGSYPVRQDPKLLTQQQQTNPYISTSAGTQTIETQFETERSDYV